MPVQVIDTLKPKNGLDFPVVEAEDVEVSEGVRLPEALNQKAEQTDLEELSSALTEKADQSDLTALTTVVNGKANTSDVTTATANLQNQINEIITPVTQDAEVQNARVGVDGTSYQTLKARIDADVDNLDKKACYLSGNTIKLDKLIWEKKIPNPNTGIPASSDTRICTKKINVPFGAAEVSIAFNNVSYKLAWYTYNNGTFIGKFFWGTTSPIVVNLTNVTDFIIAIAKSDDSDIDVSAASAVEAVSFTQPYIEVDDARVGADDTTYSTLKARLDSENSALNAEIIDQTKKAKGYIVNFYANESMYFEADGNDLYWKVKETYIRGMSFKTIAVSAYETQTSTAGETGCVKIGNNQALIAYTSGSVSVVDLANIREDSIPIFVCTQGKVVGGLGYWAYVQWKEREGEKHIESNFIKVLTSQNYDFEFVIGSLNPGSGTDFPSTTRIRSNYIRVAKGSEITLGSLAATNTLVVYEFSADKTYISDSAWNDGNAYTVQHDGYVRILIRKNSTNAEISASDVETLAANVTVILPKLEMLEQEIEDVDAKIGNVEPLPKIPEYFETAIAEAEASIKSNLEAAGVNGKTFVFCTDIHWANDTHSAPNLIARLNYDNPRIDALYLGGDYVTNGTHDAMLADMYDCIDDFGKSGCKMYSILGNHDTNVYSSGNYITLAEFYAAVQSRNDDSVVYGEYTYFYADDTKTKTRTIFIDSGMEGSTLSEGQRAWIDDVLESTPAGWHIICVWHIIYGLASGTTWQDVPLSLVPTAFSSAVFSKLDAYNELSNGAKVEAIIGGHVHCDLDYNTDGGIPIVLVDTASKQPLNGGSATVGTTTETAFDIITVDYNAKIIKCVRVGRGSDRTIEY